ncbi:MAG: amino acid synthesis family protein [Rhodobacteraceae bacterium]|nr:amino acid synthesis family protein [Paracoccaceae bacterium]
MPELLIRKFVAGLEEIHHEGGPPPAVPLRRAFALAVAANPFAGSYVEEIAGFMEDLKPLGVELSERLIRMLGGDSSLVESYGKGAIVGSAGEIEHGALWHAPGGYGMRRVLGGTKAIVPSAKKVGPPGTRLDVPLAHINAAYVRSHFDTMEIGVADAPRRDEICFVLTMATGARIHNRALGLDVADIKGEDGLR